MVIALIDIPRRHFETFLTVPTLPSPFFGKEYTSFHRRKKSSLKIGDATGRNRSRKQIWKPGDFVGLILGTVVSPFLLNRKIFNSNFSAPEVTLEDRIWDDAFVLSSLQIAKAL